MSAAEPERSRDRRAKLGGAKIEFFPKTRLRRQRAVQRTVDTTGSSVRRLVLDRVITEVVLCIIVDVNYQYVVGRYILS